MTTPTTEHVVPEQGPSDSAMLDSIDDRIINLTRMVETLSERVSEIHSFAARLAATLDALGENPMVAAMLPPGTFS